ncbi:DUF5958 family protein [Streptomyces sp. NPDC059272]|uniref:DUF5958 family protein n=1 Tax=Streptomyces sp. NPDC059272 TaxID=3346800 RepID=UPI0036CAA18E
MEQVAASEAGTHRGPAVSGPRLAREEQRGVRLPINSAAQHGVQVKVHSAQHITTCRSEAARAGSGRPHRSTGLHIAAPWTTAIRGRRGRANGCVQARATTEDGPESVRRAGLRATHTPAVLLARGPIDRQLGRIAGLTPHDERLKSFRLLIAVLAVADGRRRERFCSDGCGHAWHHLSVDAPRGGSHRN